MGLKNPRILVLGKNGQLARSFADLALDNMTFAGHAEIDLSKPGQIAAGLDQLLSRQPFDILINTAAYTQVDKAESEQDLAQTINSASVEKIARWCAARKIFFVTYSTDYVFSGEGDKPWTETDPTAPLNIYGRTKRDGELHTMNSGVHGLIIRTSWVHSAYGKNFVRTMLGLSQSPVRVVANQYGAPTYAKDLVTATLQLLEAKVETLKTSEIFHITNSGETNWYEFAREIFRLSVAKGILVRAPEVQPISSDEYRTPARRPRNSRLCSQKLWSEAKVKMPTWQSGLESCLDRIKELVHER